MLNCKYYFINLTFYQIEISLMYFQVLQRKVPNSKFTHASFMF